jgi:DNA-directed RNA polymerase I, II, and III subunit RPABC2
MQHLDIFGGGMNRPKGSDNESEYDDDELVRKNTRMNAITGAALPGKIYDSEPESGDDSDVDSKTNDSSDTDDASTVVDSDTNTDASGESDVNFDEMEDVEDTPAMIAKKTATAASALANSDAAKKKTNKRVVKGKATLEDITTLQQSYDDVELNDDTGDANDLDGDDDEDSDDGTNYLRKFDSEMRENYITSHHHEMMQLNTAEVDALVRVVRNADGVIVDSLHKTMPFLTKYEKTRILGQRAKQLNQGAQPVVPVDKKIIDGYLIAQLELQQKALPFIIRRPLPGGKSEYWRLADLELI